MALPGCDPSFWCWLLLLVLVLVLAAGAPVLEVTAATRMAWLHDCHWFVIGSECL